MDATGSTPGISYVALSPAGAHRYEVRRGGTSVGTVGRFTMGAGQFGTSWRATTPDGRTSTRFAKRDQAAAWLLAQLGD